MAKMQAKPDCVDPCERRTQKQCAQQRGGNRLGEGVQFARWAPTIFTPCIKQQKANTLPISETNTMPRTPRSEGTYPLAHGAKTRPNTAPPITNAQHCITGVECRLCSRRGHIVYSTTQTPLKSPETSAAGEITQAGQTAVGGQQKQPDQGQHDGDNLKRTRSPGVLGRQVTPKTITGKGSAKSFATPAVES